MMGRVLIGVLLIVLCATSVNAGSSEENARSAYEKGDYAKAMRLMRPLADQGQAWAQALLGAMYQYGEGGVPRDDKKAVEWYRKAAEQGNADGQFALGAMYQYGQGVPQDWKQAEAWFRKAAEQGNAFGQVSLGKIYLDGKGRVRNFKEAVVWFQKAAAQGNAWAHLWLGRMYRDGKGVPKDRVRAYMWLSLADVSIAQLRITGDANGLTDDIKSIERELNSEEMDKAQTLAQRCQDTKFKQCG